MVVGLPSATVKLEGWPFEVNYVGAKGIVGNFSRDTARVGWLLIYRYPFLINRVPIRRVVLKSKPTVVGLVLVRIGFQALIAHRIRQRCHYNWLGPRSILRRWCPCHHQRCHL